MSPRTLGKWASTGLTECTLRKWAASTKTLFRNPNEPIWRAIEHMRRAGWLPYCRRCVLNRSRAYLPDLCEYHSQICRSKRQQKSTFFCLFFGQPSFGEIVRYCLSDDLRIVDLHFEYAITSPEFTENLLSLMQLKAEGWEISLQRSELRDPTGTTFQLDAVDNLFVITTQNYSCHGS